MREPANIDAIIDLMDRTPEEMDAQNVPAPVRDRILRIRALYAWWLINPRKTDQELVFKDMQDYKVQRMMAYNDLHLIKLILGNLQKVSKDFARYRFDQMIQREGRQYGRCQSHGCSCRRIRQISPARQRRSCRQRL